MCWNNSLKKYVKAKNRQTTKPWAKFLKALPTLASLSYLYRNTNWQTLGWRMTEGALFWHEKMIGEVFLSDFLCWNVNQIWYMFLRLVFRGSDLKDLSRAYERCVVFIGSNRASSPASRTLRLLCEAIEGLSIFVRHSVGYCGQQFFWQFALRVCF